MKQELDEKLCEEFPLLYADRYASMRETCMCWGFDVGNGWFTLIYELSKKLEKLIQEYIEENNDRCECYHVVSAHTDGACSYIFETSKFNDKEIPCGCDTFRILHPKASQVKSKYAGLRFYMTSATDEMYRLIDEAEELSYKICEECGGDGKLMTTNGHPSGWQATLCNTCATTNNFFKERKYSLIHD